MHYTRDMLLSSPLEFFDDEELIALYWACADCHPGQWSEEYKRMCSLTRLYKPGPLEKPSRLRNRVKTLYNRFCKLLIGEPSNE